jgi:hypothetical protein
MSHVYIVLDADRGAGVSVVAVYRSRAAAQMALFESSHYFVKSANLEDDNDEEGYEDDGQPTEAQEWQDYDRDC